MDGALWALAGLLAAAGYQVLVKSTQENLKVCSSAFACEKIITLHTSICDLKKKLAQFSLAPHLGLHRYRHHALSGSALGITRTHDVELSYVGFERLRA